MAINLNLVDCNQAIAGTGVKGCTSILEIIQKIILVKKGWKAGVLRDLIDEASIDSWIQNGDWVVLPKHYNPNPAIEDDVKSTSAYTGEDSFVRKNPLKMMIEYNIQSSCFLRALQTLRNQQWDILFVDFDNNGNSRIWGEETVDGFFKGFDGGLINAAGLIFNNGSESTRPRLEVQLTLAGTLKFYAGMAQYTGDIDFLNLEGVNDVVINPIDLTASNFQVSVVSGCDKSSNIPGLTDVNNWIIKDDVGTVVTPSGITYANGVYTIAGLVAGDYTIDLYDVANNYEVVVVDGSYYKSNELSVTLA